MSLIYLLVLIFLSVSSKLAPLHKAQKDTIEDHYIVVFKKETPNDVFEKQIGVVQAMVGDIGHVYKKALKGFSSKLTADQLTQIRKNPFVEYVEVDQIVKLVEQNVNNEQEQQRCEFEPSDSWGQTRISQKQILLNGKYHATGTGGQGVTAYIVDTGVYVQHSDFQGRASFGYKASPSWSNTDSNGHGTHVASTTAGKLYGVAKKANIVAVKVLGDNGQGTNSGVIAGVDYVVEQHQSKGKKPSTANLSLGGSFSSALNAAITSAVSFGISFVVAAGNNDYDACQYSPASADGAITVGATNIAVVEGKEIDIRSVFSNYGSCVDVFAPGTLIKAAWIGSETAFNIISGTSMASPHVCGIATLILGDQPNNTPKQVLDLIVSTSNKKLINMACDGDKTCLQSPNYLAYNSC
jgi:subtilisin family serine protease